jgi:hypothetical protein
VSTSNASEKLTVAGGTLFASLFLLVSCLDNLFTMTMEVTRFSETSMVICRTTQYILEGGSHHSHRCENANAALSDIIYTVQYCTVPKEYFLVNSYPTEIHKLSVLCWCGVWYVTGRKKRRLRVFDDRMLTRPELIREYICCITKRLIIELFVKYCYHDQIVEDMKCGARSTHRGTVF